MPDQPYKRLISLVPSLTELLIDLGLKDHLMGRTRFCIHPENEVQDIEIIGGTKNPNINKIIELEPDFILCNKEENRKVDIEQLQEHFKVYLTDISTIEDAILEIHSLSQTLGVKDQADLLIHKIMETLNQRPSTKIMTAAYLIWKDPWMTVGNDTYIHDVMEQYSLRNVFGDKTRYPNTSPEELRSLNPDLILLSSEPFPFKQNHIEELKGHCPESNIQLINGEWFSWYGSRMAASFQHLNEWRPTVSTS